MTHNLIRGQAIYVSPIEVILGHFCGLAAQSTLSMSHDSSVAQCLMIINESCICSRSLQGQKVGVTEVLIWRLSKRENEGMILKLGGLRS